MPDKAKDDSPDVQWDEAVAVTGRPNDVPEENSTFGSRRKPETKRIGEAEDKAITGAETKRTKRSR